jgi:hypothetical protein
MQQEPRSTKKRIEQERQDTYKNRGKLSEPTVCSGCGAVFLNGRWSWAAAPLGAHKAHCPACQRIADRVPAGRVGMGGAFLREHREEILSLVRNVEATEKKEHPLERIMAISDEGDQTVVTTTGIHLARRIGESLSHSYQGGLDFRYGDGEDSIRVTWSR